MVAQLPIPLSKQLLTNKKVKKKFDSRAAESGFPENLAYQGLRAYNRAPLRLRDIKVSA